MSKEHYFLFHISFKMSRVPISPEELYDLLDLKKEGSMLNRTLIQGIVRQLDLWISSENIETIYSAFDSSTTGKVSKDCFVSKLSPKTYFKNSISEKYMISKCQFLEAILELYNKVRLKTTALLMSKITETMLETIDGGIFKELVRSLDQGICEDFCEFMFEEIQNQDSNRHVSKENLVKTLVEYGIGDKTLKSFSKE
jgi:Ca2+-binding EF-hand superfamily protein